MDAVLRRLIREYERSGKSTIDLIEESLFKLNKKQLIYIDKRVKLARAVYKITWRDAGGDILIAEMSDDDLLEAMQTIKRGGWRLYGGREWNWSWASSVVEYEFARRGLMYEDIKCKCGCGEHQHKVNKVKEVRIIMGCIKCSCAKFEEAES